MDAVVLEVLEAAEIFSWGLSMGVPAPNIISPKSQSLEVKTPRST